MFRYGRGMDAMCSTRYFNTREGGYFNTKGLEEEDE